MTERDAEDLAEDAAEALGPEAGLVARLDPLSLTRALSEVARGVTLRPLHGLLAGARFARGLSEAWGASTARAMGAEASGPMPERGDRRFSDRNWEENPF